MPKKMHAAPADYEVGRGKPPKHTQFKPGRSGNPGGRKKGSRNFSSLLKEVAQSTITVNDGGGPRQVTMTEALLLRAFQGGLSGDIRNIAMLFQYLERYLVDAEDSAAELPEEDQAILERRLGAKRGHIGDPCGRTAREEDDD